MADEASETIRTKVRFSQNGKSIVFEPQLVNVEGKFPDQAVAPAKEVIKPGQARGDMDTHTLLEKAWSVIQEISAKAGKKVALTDEDIDVFNSILATFPQQERDTSRALRKDIATMIVEVGKGKDKAAAANWRDLGHPSLVEQVRRNNLKMALLYDYIKASGGNPAKLKWETVSAYAQAVTESLGRDKKISPEILEKLAKATTTGDRDDLYQKLLAREGYSNAQPKNPRDKRVWKSQQERERVFDRLLGLRQPEVTVDPVKFLRQECYRLAVAPALEAMRSVAIAKLDKSGPAQKMVIGRPTDEEFFKGYSPALVFQTVSDETKIGQFLDWVGQGAYWRGKASIDVLYWSFYKGQLMSSKEHLAESKDADIFAEREHVSKTLRRYGGAVALSYMEKDPRLVDALNILYGLYQDKTYEEKLAILAQKYSFDPAGRLPNFVTDAVMFEKVYVRDALNMDRADLRCGAYHPAQIFDRELATDAQGRVLQFMGKNMRFTESPLIKMGWWDPSNTRFNYEAMVPDLREFNPEEYWDQKDKIWQHCGMFLLELPGSSLRDPSLRRIYLNTDEIITINGKVMTATPGQTGEYLSYQNERIKKKNDRDKGVYDHRRAVYTRIASMYNIDAQLLQKKRKGLVGWDEVLYTDTNGRGVIVREAVKRLIDFCRYDLSGLKAIEVNGIIIDKGPREIFYNDELAVLLHNFERDHTNSIYDEGRDVLNELLNMREALRDLSRCWGYAFDLSNSEVQERLFSNQDITFVENYDVAGSKAKGILDKLTTAPPHEDLYALKVTPGEILEAVEEMSHRRHKTQNYWPIVRMLAFFEGAMLRRLTEMEIASMQDLMKSVDPMGNIALGATQEVMRILGLKKKAYEAYRSILGEIDNKGYTAKMKDLRLVLAREGLIRSWTNAMRGVVERLRDAEALQWAQQRDIPLQQYAGIYEELADGYDASGRLPVESWQVVDVYRERHEIHRDDLLIQSLNHTQIENFFDEMGLQEAGEALGGGRKVILDFSPYSQIAIREGPDESSHVIDRAEINRTRPDRYLIMQRHINDQGEWFRIATEKGQELGWVHADEVDYQYETQGANDELRPGEVTHKGGRFVWVKEDEVWGWQWVQGSWQETYPDPLHTEFRFKPGEGFERRLELGTEQSVKILRDNGWIINEATLQRTRLIGPGMTRVEPANYPFLKFKSAAHREAFYNMRQYMLLSLLLGRPVGMEKGASGQAEAPRASGAALPANMFQNHVGNFMQILQFGYWITTQMRSVEVWAACRAQLLQKLEGYFGIKPPADEVTRMRIEAYKIIMQARAWGTDKEAVDRFTEDISALTFIRTNDQKTFTERLVAGGKGRGKNLGLRIRAWLMQAVIKGTMMKTELGIPINIPSALVAGPGVYTLLTLLPHGLSPWTALGGGLLSVVFSGALVGQIGARAAKAIDVDVDEANLAEVPYLRQYDAFVPLE